MCHLSADLAVYQSEDSRLTVGSRVTARWSCWGYQYNVSAQVVELESRAVTVALLEPIQQERGYPVGSRIRLPRVSDHTSWTTQHGVRLAPA